MEPSLIRICRLQWRYLFFCFISFLGSFRPKNQGCQLKLKFGIWTDFNFKRALWNVGYLYFAHIRRKNCVTGFTCTSLQFTMTYICVHVLQQNTVISVTKISVKSHEDVVNLSRPLHFKKCIKIKINFHFYFHFSLWRLIKPFEASLRNVKIKF